MLICNNFEISLIKYYLQYYLGIPFDCITFIFSYYKPQTLVLMIKKGLFYFDIHMVVIK